MVDLHFFVDLASLFGFEVDSHIAVDNRRMPADVDYVMTSDRIDGIDQMIGLVQPMALLLIPRQRVVGYKIRVVECVLSVSRTTHNNLHTSLARPLPMEVGACVVSDGPISPACVSAGSGAGGYDTILDATKHMAGLNEEIYQPIPENQKTYDRLYAEYLRLHDYFGRGENNVMRTLKQIRDEVS